MKYNYEFLRKCHGLRFKAEIYKTQVEGIVAVEDDAVYLCYEKEVLGNPEHFHRRKNVLLEEGYNPTFISDLEIVPRDPETYTDWQVGDKIYDSTEIWEKEAFKEVIFRSGELVVCKGGDEDIRGGYTCGQLHRLGYRLVLTDVEEQIIEGEKTYEPQDGDICFAETDTRVQKFIIIYNDNSYSLADLYGAGWALKEAALWAYSYIRPATDEEKQLLFDALAKEGKRWNAEKKCIEDNPVESNAEEVAAQPDVQELIREELKDYTPKGDIKGFPREVISKMLERQYEQTGKVDATVFEGCSIAAKHEGGFDWSKTKEDLPFWEGVISKRKFSVFFNKYPNLHEFKKGEPVLVRNNRKMKWRLMAFTEVIEDCYYHYWAENGDLRNMFRQCIPYNDRTMHLLGTAEDYKGKS